MCVTQAGLWGHGLVLPFPVFNGSGSQTTVAIIQMLSIMALRCEGLGLFPRETPLSKLLLKAGETQNRVW